LALFLHMYHLDEMTEPRACNATGAMYRAQNLILSSHMAYIHTVLELYLFSRSDSVRRSSRNFLLFLVSYVLGLKTDFRVTGNIFMSGVRRAWVAPTNRIALSRSIACPRLS
jgi:hypothetical protein